MVELLYNNIDKMTHQKEKLTYCPMIQTDLSTLSHWPLFPIITVIATEQRKSSLTP